MRAGAVFRGRALLLSLRSSSSSAPPPPPPPQPPPSPLISPANIAAYAGAVALGYGAGVALGALPPPPFFSEPEPDAPLPPQAEVTEKIYLQVRIDGADAGRIILGLHGGVAPVTCKNFSTLANVAQFAVPDDARARVAPGYAGSSFHRVIPGFMVQGGDTTKGDGTGGRSIFGNAFDDETFALRHRGPGILAMANAGPGTNGSPFFVTTRSAPHLDGRHVVFGCVLEGYEVVRAVEACGTASGRPARRAKIAACGSVQAGA